MVAIISRWRVWLWAGVLVAFIGPNVRPAQAVSQWARKYGEPCSTCHNIFPRLNYYGERFVRNGYQNPDDDEPDGDKTGKKRKGDRLVVDEVGNWLGARLNVTPIRARTHSLDRDGDKKTRLDIGNPNWLQLFVAGSIFKDASIFIENEFEPDAFKFNWFYLGFHNLAGPYVNVQIGNVAPLLFASFPNRLPLFPALKNEAMRIKGSNGKGEDGLDTSSARPGIVTYGEKAFLVWWAGISPGRSPADKNDQLNYWAGARFEIIEDWDSVLEGSSVSLHYQVGTDAANTGTDAKDGRPEIPQVENRYQRIVPSLNVRFKEWDTQAGLVYGKEDNWSLSDPAVEGKFYGWTFLTAYVMDAWVPGVQWDVTKSIDPDGNLPTEHNRLTPSVTYGIRENMRLTLYGGLDLQGDSPKHPDKTHDVLLNFRVMF